MNLWMVESIEPIKRNAYWACHLDLKDNYQPSTQPVSSDIEKGWWWRRCRCRCWCWCWYWWWCSLWLVNWTWLVVNITGQTHIYSPCGSWSVHSHNRWQHRFTVCLSNCKKLWEPPLVGLRSSSLSQTGETFWSKSPWKPGKTAEPNNKVEQGITKGEIRRCTAATAPKTPSV